MKGYIEAVITNQYEIEVYECVCGYHMGLDSSYTEQVEDVEVPCPACKAMFTTKH